MPNLSQFIRENREDILGAWETFARELPAGGAMDVVALRDHADAMLDVIIRDLDAPETEEQRSDKARGASDVASGAEMTAASLHGLGRAESGFSVESMFAEFRALRASVIQLWRAHERDCGPHALEEMTRFNEAIDQAMAESLNQYMREVETTRDRFFAVLGHDLRTPLGAIITSTQFLGETADLTGEQRTIVAGMERSARRMTELVRDLLDLALTRLGSGIPIRRAEMDLGALVRDVAAEAVASSPRSRIEIETRGALRGVWDRARLAQALTNLLGNAIQHGAKSGPIKLIASGEHPASVTVSVSNDGPPIPNDRIGAIFDAMKGGSGDRDRRHLGLGLYIVDKIVEAHGGSIDVRSSHADGTTFALSLPRRAA